MTLKFRSNLFRFKNVSFQKKVACKINWIDDLGNKSVKAKRFTFAFASCL